ncbi:MAG: 2-hydroxyacyl-CoA dehydratase family protein [Bacillota bacterium]
MSKNKQAAKGYLPLDTTKKLKSTMGKHYLLARYHKYWGRPLNKKVAWVTSGFPVEILRAFNVFPVYPENYGAVCGTARVSTELCKEAESAGYLQDLCSYARSNIGSITRKDLAPAGGLPKPDFIAICNNICGTVLKWYESLARIYNVPMFIIDTPFIVDRVEEHHVQYVLDQFKNLISELEQFTGRQFDLAKLERIISYSDESIKLWQEIRSLCKTKPSPLNIPDMFLHLAPIVSLRGTAEAVNYYKTFRGEVLTRVKNGVAAVPGEKYRLLWDNIAIWYKLFAFFKMFTERKASFVVDTYSGGWAMDLYLGNPLESLAETYTAIFLNRSVEFRAQQIVELIGEYQVDGFVMHSNRSCKPYSLVQEEVRRIVTKQTGIPGVLIEADMADSRAYSEEQVRTRVQAFMETLEII